MSDSELPLVQVRRFAKASEVPWKRDLDCASDNRGSYSTVFRAELDSLTFAVKEIRRQMQSESHTTTSVVDSTMSELQLLKICKHENVAEYIAAYTLDTIADRVFIVTRPWADMNLADFLGLQDAPRASSCDWWTSRGAFDKCNALFKGLINGLDFLHYNDIFHKDIKPENIVLSGQTPVIVDFGISKLYKPGAETNYTKSTWRYLAPEQNKHESSSPKSDVFSMGCCFLLIGVIALQPQQGFREIEAVFDRAQVYQFGDRGVIVELLGMLSTLNDTSASWPVGCLKLFIREMLLLDPLKRLSSARLRELLTDINEKLVSSRAWIQLPSWPLRMQNAIDSVKFRQPTVQMLSGYSPSAYQWLRPIVRVGDKAKTMIAVASLDTGSSLNMMSLRGLERLQASVPDIRPVPVDFVLRDISGRPFRISCEVKCLVRLAAVQKHVKFQMLDSDDLPFDFLLGKPTISALDILGSNTEIDSGISLQIEAISAK